MYFTEEILEKLNSKKKLTNSLNEADNSAKITLPDIMVRSFSEVKELAGNSITWGEKNFLYQQAQEDLKENKMAESRILSRASPQLANAVRLGIRQSAMLQSYNDLFPARASNFVKPGSVASMFSSAAYLTELYREARNLHADTSAYHLDTRRPDLASLSLSQSNMDDELSTLSLSNELLLNIIEIQKSKDRDGVLEMLSTYRQTGSTPYHHPYEATRQSIILQDPEFSAFRGNPEIAKMMDYASLLGIQADISPELRGILTEEITEENSAELIKKNFGDSGLSNFRDTSFFAHWYGLSYNELSSFFNVLEGNNIWIENTLSSCYLTASGFLQTYSLTRTPGDNYEDQLEYMDLFCTDGNKFYIKVKFRNDYGRASVKLTAAGSDIYLTKVGNTDGQTLAGVVYQSSIFSLDDGVLAGMFELYLYRYGPSDSDARISSRASFNFTNASAESGFEGEAITALLLLKLNKIIRLYKATGISSADIRTVIESSNTELRITDEVLGNLFRVNYYMQHYGADLSAALVLSGAAIGQVSRNGQTSTFNRLFNTPPLNKKTFTADGTILTLKPADVSDTFRTCAMKRAFGVNDMELYTLWSLASGKAKPEGFACTIDNISTLYRVSLLADAHGLSVSELAMLLSVSPYAGVGIAGLSEEALATLVSFLGLYTQWLTEQKMTVTGLTLMLTDNYSTVLSPDIENLVTTLKNGLSNQDLSNTDEAGLICATAPFIAASMQMDSAETAAAILQWLGQLKPAGLTVSDFLSLADNDARKNEETTKLVCFCQVLGQLVLIVRTLSLTASELSLAVTQPEKLVAGATKLLQDIATVRTLSRFHHWLQKCGASATEILSALANDTLTPAQLAQAMTLDEQVVTQGLAQVNDGATAFSGWSDTDTALQWANVATLLGITPSGVRSLVNLDYSDPDNLPSYAGWVDISHVLQAGLSSLQTSQLQTILDEALSAAISVYVIKNIAPDWVTERNSLYSWLLIDNQVSAQIKTTRIAEAIAGVQLYVNLTLSNQEEDVVSTVKSRQFFIDWDTYNKRYSTWVGVSQLVYYPENYIDPTLRIGQTSMMDEMLQTLSQSQLTSDMLEDTFKTYMTRFEEIANLDVISGYHDSVSDQNGTTYIIGCSAIDDYYWRSADINKVSDGKLPANAWSEWKKITVAVAPVNNLVRPVIFQSRLYLIWVESREVSVNSDNTSKQTTEYLLKYAHILHDGSWSGPVTITTGQNILPLSGVSIDDCGIYCAKDVEQEKLYIFFYKKESSYSTLPDSIVGLSLSSEGTVENISVDSAVKTSGYIYLQLDTTSDVRLNTPFAGGNTRISLSDTPQADYSWGDGYYTIMNGGRVSPTSAEMSEDSVIITFNAIARLVYNGLRGTRSRSQVDMMRSNGSIGQSFYLPQDLSAEDYCIEHDFTNECIVNQSLGKVYFMPSEGYLAQFEPAAFNIMRDTVGVQATQNSAGFLEGSCSDFQPLTEYISIYPYLAEYLGFTFSNFNYIDTDLPGKKVVLSISVVNKEFTADICSKYTFDESLFNFNNKSITVPMSAFRDNTLSLSFTFSATAPSEDGRSLGDETRTLTLTRVDESTMPIISLNKSTENAQYLQCGVYRTRVNTLFAKQLVARANSGLNAVFSMETQTLQEPQLGKGFYADFGLPAYDADIHGSSRDFTLNIKHVVDNDPHVVYSGMLTDTQTNVTLFIPLDKQALNFEFCARIFMINSKIGNSTWLGAHFAYTDRSQVAVQLVRSSDISMFTYVNINAHQTTESMDFSGANALYFWEMFYYVPMMVFKRLLSEGKFTEATQWIKYIWNPDGDLVHGEQPQYQWNVRPLQEETTWHANPLDSVDPDAVAQADPMHYKVTTFMCWLDLLIARGDAAYRQLERDTLNEAKMWYVQALSVLGDEPNLSITADWSNPSLEDAASQTTQVSTHQALQMVRQQMVAGELRSANSLTALFLPQQNEKLAGYWQTLAQRLYNLRYNLSIDGNPLSLSIYASPVAPTALLSAAVMTSQGGSDLPTAVMPLHRFPVILDSARSMVSQLSQFGNTLLGITERQDAETLSELLQTQGAELVLQSIARQDKTIAEIDADKTALEESRSGAQSRLDSYTMLYDENVNSREDLVIDLALSASVLSSSSSVSYAVAAGLDAVPNIYGMAFGGSQYGGLARAVGITIEMAAGSCRTASDRIRASETYRRRRQDWEIQRNAAQSTIKQIDAQLNALAVRREGAVMQKTYLETQQAQTQAQMTFLKNKFTSKALYNWLRGKLAAIYYQFYDLTVSRCLMAQEAYKWTLGTASATFIRPGAWNGTYAGLMAGETLMLSLAQMEQAYLQKDQREKAVTRTVCLSEVYAALASEAFSLADEVRTLVTDGNGSAGSDDNGLAMTADKQLQATLKLADLNISDDYPASLGTTRRIKQISVTLPVLTGQYQDVRAVLSYGGSVVVPRGCEVLAVSHGQNDSGQFQLDFNDARWLPFEGIPVADEGTLTLSFPDVDAKQKDLLLSLTDIILHIRYTIIS